MIFSVWLCSLRACASLLKQGSLYFYFFAMYQCQSKLSKDF
nr:hypothetical protein [uncultured Campylobacter sp.]